MKESDRRTDFSSHKSDSDSSESGRHRLSPTELGRRGIYEFGRRRISEQQRSIANLLAEFNEELRAQQAMFLSAKDELETRQADTLANAWAVFEHSIANMRSPAEVNSTNERVIDDRLDSRPVEAASNRSVESEV